MRLMLALLLLLLATMPAAAQENTDVVPVVIALERLPRGLVLTEENVLGINPVVGIVFYPADSLPATALQSLDNLVGKVLRTDIEVENPLVEHYFFPYPNYPISPMGYYVVREYGAFVEYTLDDRERVTHPARLAAGDRVDVIFMSNTGDILLDEARLIIEGVIVARVTEDAITLSLTPPERASLSAIWESGFSVTLVIRSLLDSQPVRPPTPPISWTYLTTRDLNPLLIPEDADISRLEWGQ